MITIKSDAEVTDDDLKGRHVLLIGRPATNRLSARFKATFPVEFGSGSFTVGKDVYANAGSAVLVVGENPSNPRYSAVMIAGLGADATYHAATRLASRGLRDGEAVVVPHGGTPRSLVVSSISK